MFVLRPLSPDKLKFIKIKKGFGVEINRTVNALQQQFKILKGAYFHTHALSFYEHLIWSFQWLVVLVITLNISLCNRYLLCFRHIVSEYNYVSGDILIKMLIS